jgi:beta-N-acetylhexosaminidase
MKRSYRRVRIPVAVAALASAATLFLTGVPSPSLARADPGRDLTPSALTPQQLAGQRVIYSYSGLTPPASLLQLIRHGEAAGVIFFGGNISSEAQIRGVIGQLNQANSQSPVKLPLLLMTDQEGGLVRRLPGAPTASEKQIGLSAHPISAAHSAGTGAGQNLRGVGMNVNLAPVLDVYRHPGDFDDQFQRSYSMNPATVAQLGADFIGSQQQAGVAATGKHFPGLGAAAASQNTDLGPVTLNLHITTIRRQDEVPYVSAIGAGVRLVMVSWAVYPVLDAHRPAGLSSAIVQGELRNRLGFHGVTITDAIEAGALQFFGTAANRGVLAAQAGMDLLLFSGQSVSEGTSGLNGLVTALGNGQLNPAAFNSAVQRVMALRSGL